MNAPRQSLIRPRLSLIRPPLPDYALAYLAERGIDEAAARKRNLRALTADECNARFNWASRALLIPYHDANGAPLQDVHGHHFARARLFDTAPDENPTRFLQEKGSTNHFYLDPSKKNWRQVFADPAIKLAITEGEVKAMCATEHGIPCVALSGVHSWRTQVDAISAPLPDFDDIEWVGRVVELAFDSDAASNPQVRYALDSLAAELVRRGATVRWVRLPPSADGGKVGLDDFLVGAVASGADPQQAYEKLPRPLAQVLLRTDEPLPTAKTFLGPLLVSGGARLLHRHSDTWYAWSGAGYQVVSDEEIRSAVYSFLENATEPGSRSGKAGVQPYQPTQNRVNPVLDALRAEAHLETRPPCWLDSRTEPPPHELIPFQNGLLHGPTRELLPTTPHFFSTAAPREFDYNPRAPQPARWIQFLNELFEFDDRGAGGARNTLQEIFGYLLTPDTRQHKIFLIVGPPRAGKGTLMRVLAALAGRGNVAGPTVASLDEQFGMAALIDKPLAIIADARLGGADQRVLTERLLAISGEDPQTVNRKYREPWTGTLPTRFVIVTNELPRFSDASGALPSRLLPIILKQSFLGREDTGLTEKLFAELPGIFNWALEGLDRLRARGRFEMPPSSKEAMQDLGDLAAPVAAFIRDRCNTGTGLSIECDGLYKAYRAWCIVKGLPHIDAQHTFGRNLKAQLPGLSRTQPRAGDARVPTYIGITLRGDVGQ